MTARSGREGCLYIIHLIPTTPPISVCVSPLQSIHRKQST